MAVVNSAVYDLKVGAHAEPTESLVPNQGDWQWCMMEAAAWIADEAWSDDPANVSPVIVAVCNSFNDLLPDTERQDLVALLVAAPAGVIDTIDGAKETAREWMCVDWLVRTLLPMYLDYSTDTDVLAASTAIKALPALAAGTFDEAATLAALETAGRAVWAWRDTMDPECFEVSGGGGPSWAAVSVPTMMDLLGGDDFDHYYGQARGVDGHTTGAALLMDTAKKAALQAAWDLVLSWVPNAFFTGRSVDYAFRRGGNYVPGSAFMLIRDTVWALVSAYTVTDAISTAYDNYEVGYTACYEAALTAGQTQLVSLGVAADAAASMVDLIGDLSAY